MTRRFEAVTRRESTLVLFHLLGKVLYNKRKYVSSLEDVLSEAFRFSGKGDSPSSSASAKDIQREREKDAILPDSPPLPGWLAEHSRRTSRVDVDVRVAFKFSDITRC